MTYLRELLRSAPGPGRRRAVLVAIVCAMLGVAPPASSAMNDLPGGVVVSTELRYEELLDRLETAIKEAGLGIVAVASASRGAAARGVRIPGNAVVMVFRNDIAVRLLASDVAAGFEAPLRFYVTENPDGSASLGYRKPSVVFAPYSGAEVGAIARELDRMFEQIVSRVVRN